MGCFAQAADILFAPSAADRNCGGAEQLLASLAAAQGKLLAVASDGNPAGGRRPDDQRNVGSLFKQPEFVSRVDGSGAVVDV
ncbi:Unannotated [Lentimonas sp. CC19]|nr:Unannotated [Lentimonas sp. CC4]CAA6684972.1 Unannotated [Lentimonas sp. CC6]CAA6691744.1 Unannotated [Lentimonas sp. CC19]CAA6696110.1 Unannotated [Lentimonas sp. CC10]CAA7070095.1 Unannotated [Lentimonas sp. CC11]CAA7169837.1 Unannotated [Lentimonas sp. CC21]CAA7179956.1 Unannotated [Lentimonas sp. CC8]